jgi:membrane-associated protease RseP (regulator of RpoE activity)
MTGMIEGSLVGQILTWTGILLLITLWHEAGHAVAAKWVGIPVRRLGIGMGPALWRFQPSDPAATVIELRALPIAMAIAVPARRAADGRRLRPLAHDLWTTAGGPIASFVLTAVLAAAVAAFPLSPAVAQHLVAAGVLSAVIAIFNLIPVPGLDGGHLLMLSLAHFGYELPVQQERTLMRRGVYAMAAISLLSPVLLWITKL